jgi:hypothetical protein
MNHKCGITPENITHLEPEQIFVFGSNLAGVHGAGAASLARKWGAEWGKGYGLFGQTYALPTKDRDIETLSIGDIRIFVSRLKACIKENPDLHFLITKVGCGLAGYSEKDIGPLFEDFLDIPNCSLPIEFIEINQ